MSASFIIKGASLYGDTVADVAVVDGVIVPVADAPAGAGGASA